MTIRAADRRKRNARIVAMYCAGCDREGRFAGRAEYATYESIAKSFGVTRQAVQQIVLSTQRAGLWSPSTTVAGGPRRISLDDRFWSKVLKTDSCWLWLAGQLGGYGRVRRGSRNEGWIYTHRLSWELAHGPVPDGLFVLHKNECHNRSCVNPSHLYLGTAADNMRDLAELTTHCVHGHSYTDSNTVRYRGRRNVMMAKSCRQCRMETSLRHRRILAQK